MREILFRDGQQMFSFRVAGILIRDGKVLLQKPPDDDGYSLPGGHVEFGETGAQTLAREFKEETGADVAVHELKWVGEITFPWGGKLCQQIGLYYHVELLDGTQLPPADFFMGEELVEGIASALGFRWVPVERLGSILVYPRNIADLLQRWDAGIQHFIAQD